MIFADKHNWKYAWFGEHHALTEYSHMSAPEVVMGYVAAQTDYIHLSTGITSLSPRKEHPVRFAERAAMLDHFTNRRFEWGTGRGAGGHESPAPTSWTELPGRVGEVVKEIPRMWEQGDFESTANTSPSVSQQHPASLRAGSPADLGAWASPTFNRAASWAWCIAFNFEPIFALRGVRATRKASRTAPPPSAVQDDNVMITNSVICPNRKEARDIGCARVAATSCRWSTYITNDAEIDGRHPVASTPNSLRELAAGDTDALSTA